MSNTKKLMMTAAGGDAVNVEDVFSAYAYDGNNSTQTITNGIDLDGEGGMVWIKGRNNSDNSDHLLFDTERGATKWIRTNATSGTEITNTSTLTGFNSDGFDVGSYVYVNGSGYSSFPDRFISYAFRKHPNFFNVKKFTTSYNTEPHTISTGLDADLGMAWFRSLDNSTQGTKWTVWHRERQGYYTNIGSTVSWTNSDSDFAFNTSTQEFTLGYPMSDAGSRLVAGNQETQEVIGYFFAHNNNDGVFGPTGDQDIIKCGKYTGNSGTLDVNVGFTAGMVLIKHVNANSPWLLYDLTRGMGAQSLKLLPPFGNRDADEGDTITPTPNGFRLVSNSYDTNSSGNDYCYMVIRRGPMAIPTNATDVFDVAMSLNPAEPTFVSGFPVDMSIHKDKTGGATINGARIIQNKKLSINSNAAESSGNDEMIYSFMDGFYEPLDYGSPPGGIGSTNFVSYMWKAAPNYFDVVAYTGTGSSSLTVDHNLGVVPEMMWVKRRSGISDWKVYHKDLTNTNSYLVLNSNAAEVSNQSNVWPTAPTDTQLTIGNYTGDYTGGGDQGIAYLFASLNGVSKVGSFSHTSGTTQNIDCGFSSGARFVLVKQYASTGSWFVYDTERGIVSGNDPRLKLDSTAAENTGNDDIDPYSAGFTLTTNFSGGSYIFYAVA